MPGHVLKEAPLGSDFFDDTTDLGPQMPWVVCTFSLTCKGEGLAGITASDDAYAAAKWFCIESSQIRPNRARIQATFFHRRDQSSAGVGFDLHSNDDSASRNGQAESGVETPSSRA